MEWTNRFNPFNSDKLFAHLDTWKKIKRGERLPAPVLVTIDPTNLCNLNCGWCNSQNLRRQNATSMSSNFMFELGNYLSNWGTQTACIAGGGEPTNHPDLDTLIQNLLSHNVRAGMVTNGTNLDRHSQLSGLDWIGVSVDCGTPETYLKLKGKDYFRKVIENIKRATGLVGNLSQAGKGHGVSYKYLLTPENCGEVYRAAELAKELRCRNLHIRPVGNPWDRHLDKTFSYSDIELFKEQLEQARTLEDANFGVYGVTHKFDGDFRKANNFKECYAIFMTADFQPSETGFNFGLCCDRRGDKRLTIPMKHLDEVGFFWGSEKHWQIFDGIKPSECPRCTYQPHNQIFENAIKTDNMSYKFI